MNSIKVTENLSIHNMDNFAYSGAKHEKNPSHNCPSVELWCLYKKHLQFQPSFCDVGGEPVGKYISLPPFRIFFDYPNSTRWQYLMNKWY